MFEPMSGSALKYTGQGKINPVAAVAAIGMLLDQVVKRTQPKELRKQSFR